MNTKLMQRALLICAAGVFVTALAPTLSRAQDTIRVQNIDIEGLEDNEFPIPIDFRYDNEEVKVFAQKNGKTSDPVDPAVGNFNYITIYGVQLKPGQTTTVMTPQGRKIIIRVDVTIVEIGGKVYIIVTVTIRDVP